MSKRLRYLVLILGILAILLALAATTPPAGAMPKAQANPPDPNLSISDEVCLDCHGQPGLSYTLQDGTAWDLYVPQEAYQQSIHGSLGYACVQCHRQVGNYPHPPFQAAELRDAQLKLNDACQFCHTQQYELASDSVHAAMSAAGNRAAAVCIDCHTAHDVRRLNDPKTHTLLPQARVWIPQTCARCHSAIYDQYKNSVHGSALIGEGNPDVPTCIDCHGVHNIPDPRTASFRLSSPQMCGKCHTDPKVVGKYGLSTNVLETYVADFHGTTVVLFEKQSPDEQTNKPVCYDCHGIHDIARADDPQKGLQVRRNLLARCQECHPNATENFPEAWLSHYTPSPEKYPLVYYVNLFYKFFIPTVLGGMGILVAMDMTRSAINRWAEFRKQRLAAAPQAAEEKPALLGAEETVANPVASAPEGAPQIHPEPAAEGDEPPAAPENPNPEMDQDLTV